MDVQSEKAELAVTYGRTYPVCLESGGLMPVRVSNSHLKVPLLITIPPPPPRVHRREYIIDEEAAQETLLSEYRPFTQWAAVFLIFVGLLVSSWVVYMAVLVSTTASPHGLKRP